MLPLLERVVGHLERVQRVADKTVVEREVPLDLDNFQAFVLEAFDSVEVIATQSAARLNENWRWNPAYLRAFVEELHWILLDGVGAQWSSRERFDFIKAGLLRASDLGGTGSTDSLSRSRTLMLAPILETALQNIGHGEKWWRDRAPWNVAPRYCEHLGLTDAGDEGAIVRPAGATLIRLRGMDRLRWILAMETSLATSAHDTWCIDLHSVKHLAQGTEWSFGADPIGPPVGSSTFGRWTEFGALEYDHESYFETYAITPVGQKLFGELARDETTSFRTLARALLEDERELVLAPVTGTDPSPDRATAATLRHARMVAHEVRNALLPVGYALKKIWAHPAVSSTELSVQRRRVDDGIARLHRFVDDSLRLTPLVTEEQARFSIMEVIDEARRECVPGPEGGITIETRPASANPYARGHRGRLVLALLNLLRNAVQVGGSRVRIQISVDAQQPGIVTIRVRDDGPGIPPERRATLFENGVSHREGGSGHGLFLVRLVVEKEMGGQVRLVSDSDQSGACFELEIPTEEDGQ